MAEVKAKKGKHSPKKQKAESLKSKAPAAGKKASASPWGVLLYPHLAEKSMNMVELENKLVFIVDRKANRGEIKSAVESGFAVKVMSVNTEITQMGVKKAYVKLHPDFMAADIASKMGML